MLHQAYQLFDGYRVGEIFTDMAPARLRRIGMSMVALAVLRPMTAALVSMLVTAGNPPGQRMLAIGLDIGDYMIAAFGGLILAIGHVMVEAKRLADDNQADRLRSAMTIIVNLDVMLAKRKMRSKELAERIGITEQNVSLLKSGKVKGVRFDTLEKICEILDCQPGDILEYRRDADAESARGAA